MTYKPLLPMPLNVIELYTVGSSNDYAKDLARKGASAGTVVWAHTQTAGRGRQGNDWVSPPGNLYMSMILRPHRASAETGQLSFLCAVALANVLQTIVPASSEVRLKWPNDLLINKRKAAGILLETEGQAEYPLRWVVAGIGVNIVSAPEGAICLHDVAAKSYEAGHVLEFLAKEIHLLSKRWEQEGFAPVREAWLNLGHRPGESVTARLPHETLTGVFEGLDETGALLLKLPDGRQRIISSGEILIG